MTRLEFKNIPANGSFNKLMDDFFPALPSLFSQDSLKGFQHAVPVNVIDTAEGFILEISAPGFEKENFKINLEQNILTVSADKKEAEEKEERKFIRREIRTAGIKRSFTLPENINADEISAKYVNGILQLNLPRKQEVRESGKQITIQ